jgi:tRNA nucleotidyltransferase/poly(A) polymerase
MDIDYKLLQERINKMETQQVLVREEAGNYNISNVMQLPKNDLNLIRNMEALLFEKETLKNKIKELMRENEQLRKENNAKNNYKNYILEIDKLMDKLPSTKDYSKKVELISRFVDYSLLLFQLMDNIPLNKSARFGYKERVLYLRYCLTTFHDVVQQSVSQLTNGINNIGSMPRDGLNICGIDNIRTLDDLINKVCKKKANLSDLA